MFLLFAAQQAVQNGSSGFSALEVSLMGAIAAVVLGVSGFITWLVKSAAPRIMAGFEKRNDALIAASEKTADAVGKIPEAIKSFEIGLLGAEKRLVEKIDESQDKIVVELRDSRISELARAVRESNPGPKQGG